MRRFDPGPRLQFSRAKSIICELYGDFHTLVRPLRSALALGFSSLHGVRFNRNEAFTDWPIVSDSDLESVRAAWRIVAASTGDAFSDTQKTVSDSPDQTQALSN